MSCHILRIKRRIHPMSARSHQSLNSVTVNKVYVYYDVYINILKGRGRSFSFSS